MEAIRDGSSEVTTLWEKVNQKLLISYLICTIKYLIKYFK